MFLWMIFANSLPVITADNTDQVASYKGKGSLEKTLNAESFT